LRRRLPRDINLEMANPELSRDELEARCGHAVSLIASSSRTSSTRSSIASSATSMRAWDARLQARGAVAVDRAKPSQGSSRAPVILPLGSMFLGVLATAAVAEMQSAAAAVVIGIVAWIAIVAVNVVHAVRR
jgi:hypothetical protein